MENETPLYATVLYKVRQVLDISWGEYIYLDMVQKLSIHRPWCAKPLSKCADDLGMTKRGVIKMRDRLLEAELLEKNDKGHLRVTPKYTEVAVNKVHRPANQSVNLVPKSVNKVHQSGELSSLNPSVENNNRITKKEGELASESPLASGKSFRAQYERLRAQKANS